MQVSDDLRTGLRVEKQQNERAVAKLEAQLEAAILEKQEAEEANAKVGNMYSMLRL